MLFKYNRSAAIKYAQRWALDRNPKYYNYDKIGGDCTNFVSQCLYAGSGVMNYTPTFGWYYINANRHAPAWTGVEYFYNFLTGNSGAGPAGIEVSMDQVVSGDVSQFAKSTEFTHSQVIVSAGNSPNLDNILVCAHTIDSLNRQLSSYVFEKIRFIHIQGYRN